MTTAQQLDFGDYLTRPGLSASGAKKILKAPALYRHEADNPPKSKPHFDFGKVVHTLVLGVGDRIEVIAADDWRGKAAREARDEATAAGRIPLLMDDYLTAEACAAAVTKHRLASALLAEGEPEQSWFWRSGDVDMKARTDWLTRHKGQHVLADLKTAQSADPREFRRAAATFGYHIQDAIHREGVQQAIGEPVGFIFVVVEKTAPHLVSVVELDDVAKAHGEWLAEKAKATYAECLRTGIWPGYPDGIHTVSLPNWALTEEDQ